MAERVRVQLECTAEVRATLAAQKISTDPESDGAGEFIAVVHDARTPDRAVTALRQALKRWGDVPLQPFDE